MSLDAHAGSAAELLTAAIAKRRNQVQAFFQENDLASASEDQPRLALVELCGPEHFQTKRDPQGRGDPKFALRLGLADVGLVS